MDAIYHAMNPWWEGGKFDSGITREKYLNDIRGRFNRKQIEVLIGSRRVGKTTLVKQLIRNLLEEGTPADSILYLQLDHPQLSGKTPLEHLKEFRKNFMHDRSKKLFLFLDEVQETPAWESQLKAMYDTDNIKITCAGSTASLVKSQGGKLTGRQIVTHVYPLDFNEYLTFKGKKPGPSEDYKYERLAEEYLNEGGYPENVLQPSTEYLKNLIEDILARDLIRLYDLRKPWILKDLLKLLAASVGSRTSYNKLANTLGTTVDTIKEYTSLMESAFLLKKLEKYSTSHTDKAYSPKKIYLSDTGFKTLLTGEGDLGAKAENTVYLKLLRSDVKCGYYTERGREVDFVCEQRNKATPVEVKYTSSFDWKDVKYSGIRLYLKSHDKTREAHIISKDVEKQFTENKIKVKVTPLWKFLMQD